MLPYYMLFVTERYSKIGLKHNGFVSSKSLLYCIDLHFIFINSFTCAQSLSPALIHIAAVTHISTNKG